MTGVADVAAFGDVTIISVNSPPVNALSARVRKELHDLILAERDTASEAIVIICGGRTFFAGADIAEFGRPVVGPDLAAIFEAIEESPKPVVAAIHGTALGGGLELALACHYRVALPSARLGLPEVKLGLLPGAGGTQRLPRIVGVASALDLIVSGKQLSAEAAHALGIVDALVQEPSLVEGSIAFARSIIGKPVMRVRDRDERVLAARQEPAIFDAYRKNNAKLFRGFKAPENIVKAIEASVELPFDAGLAREKELFLELGRSQESKAQRYYFFAERETAKIPDIPKDIATLPISAVGVIGAGTMGSGIAINFLNAGIPVTLVETTHAALERGAGNVRKALESSLGKGRISQSEFNRRMGLFTLSLSINELGDCDLIIEAVFEEMAIKEELFSRLDGIAKARAILASNTSYLDLDRIAAATTRPDFVIGLHFFSPANIMRLLEVVRGAETAPIVIATAMKLAKTLGKVSVLSRVCDGFIANRIMRRRQEQADQLILEGPSPSAIDKALVDYGFAIGPFQMIDLVGLDVIGRNTAERSVVGDLVAMGRHGQKHGGGYYDYDTDRRSTPSAEALGVIAAFARDRGIEQGPPQSAEQIRARLLFPVVNEAARLLEEGVALRASDVDVAAILGYNWPLYTGGPLFWADTVGLQHIVDTLRRFAAEHDASLKPCDYLVDLAASGGSFSRG